MRPNSILAVVLAALGMSLMAAGLPDAAAPAQPEQTASTLESCAQDLDLGTEAGTATTDSAPALGTQPEPTEMNNYQQCWDSWFACDQDCQFYSEPTRSQCVYWCYQTHWCAQV